MRYPMILLVGHSSLTAAIVHTLSDRVAAPILANPHGFYDPPRPPLEEFMLYLRIDRDRYAFDHLALANLVGSFGDDSQSPPTKWRDFDRYLSRYRQEPAFLPPTPIHSARIIARKSGYRPREQRTRRLTV